MKTLRRKRHLGMETLEDRRVMAGVPVLNSLQGAANTVYLDFDGHAEVQWLDYYNVVSKPFDRDGNAGDFNADEVAAIKQVWGIVAEDFAPFNVNVTTVAPVFGDPKVVRVVIGGQESASYVDPRSATWKTVSGASFLLKSDYTPDPASGITSSIGAYRNADSNTAYVFSDFRYAPLPAGSPANAQPAFMTPEQIGNTASHEAGHAFGLWHHQRLKTIYSGGFEMDTDGKPLVVKEYEPAVNLTTPIMGDNLATGQRHVWSVATNRDVPGYTQNGFFQLMLELGLREDEAGTSLATAQTFSFMRQIHLRDLDQRSGTAGGVISTRSDRDYYAFQSRGGTFSIDVNVAQNPNLDSKLEVFRKDTVVRVINGVRTTQSVFTRIAQVDPPQGIAPNFDAKWSGTLAAGNYIAVVGSSDNFYASVGDVGQYTLVISETTRSASRTSAVVANAADAAFAMWDVPSNPKRTIR